jgi:hypothetical protein
MNHLSESEIADYVESRLASNRLAHAERCGVCSERADALRRILAEALRDEMPAPSPLYWDHFAARVADAIRDETPDPAPLIPASWRGAAVTRWAVAAATAIVVMTTIVWRATLHAPVRRAVPPAAIAAVSHAPVEVAPDDIETDQAWAVVRTATDGLGWDEAQAAGISARPGSAEGVALELSAEERAELARLIGTEMKRRGA